MNQSLVAVIDGTKARFFTLESASLPEYQSGPNLIECNAIFDRAKELQGKELWANTKTGRNRGKGSRSHGYDDRRSNHLNQFELRFAKEIVNQILQLTQRYRSPEIVLVAEPQILGMLREVLYPIITKNLKIQELAKDLCKLKSQAIHEYLAKKEILPARKVVLQ
ncbi:MAG: host attachment protein [Prochloraceae cyanobacterium]